MFEPSPEKRTVLREVRYILQHRTTELEDAVPEDIIEFTPEGTTPVQQETKLFMDDARMDERALTEKQITQEPYIIQAVLELTNGFVDEQLARYKRILVGYKKRAESCGCRKCWADYEHLRDEYVTHFGVPDAEQDVAPREVAQFIEKYVPKLD